MEIVSDCHCGVYRHGSAWQLHVNIQVPSPWWDEFLPGEDVLSAQLEAKHNGSRRAEARTGKEALPLNIFEHLQRLSGWESLKGPGSGAPIQKGNLGGRTEMTLASKNAENRWKGSWERGTRPNGRK